MHTATGALGVKARTSRPFSLFFGYLDKKLQVLDYAINVNYPNVLFQSKAASNAIKTTRELASTQIMRRSKTASKSDDMADLEASAFRNAIGPCRVTLWQQKRASVRIAALILDFVWPILKV